MKKLVFQEKSIAERKKKKKIFSPKKALLALELLKRPKGFLSLF